MKQNFLKICAGTLCAVALSGCLAACGADSAETAADRTESKSETLSDNDSATAAAITGTTGSIVRTAKTDQNAQTTEESKYTVVRPKNSSVVVVTTTGQKTTVKGELSLSACSTFLENYYETYGTAEDDYQIAFDREDADHYYYILKNIVITYNEDGSVDSEKSGLLQVGTVTVNKQTGEVEEYITDTKKVSKFRIP